MHIVSLILEITILHLRPDINDLYNRILILIVINCEKEFYKASHQTIMFIALSFN